MPDNQARPRTPRWRRGLLAAAGLLGLGLLLLRVGYALRRPTPEPPALDLGAIDDPVVATAIGEAREEVARAPRSASAWGRLGMLLLAHEFSADARTALAQAEQLDAQDPRWPYLQGVILQQDDPQGSLPPLRRACQLSHEPAVQLRLAEALLALGQVDEAEGLFRATEQAAPPNNIRAQLGLAQVARARGNRSASLLRLRAVADVPGGNPKQAHRLLAEIYAQLGQRTEAEREREIVARLVDDAQWPDPYTEEVSAQAVGPRSRIERAEVLRHTGRANEAVALLRENTRIYPDSDAAWLSLGWTLVQVQRFPEAEQAYRQAARHASGRNAAQCRLGLGIALYHQRGRRRDALPEAAECFRQALRVAPSLDLARMYLARSLEDLGDVEGAAAAYATVLRGRPDLSDAHENLGHLLAAGARSAAVAATLPRLLGCPDAIDLTVAVRLQALAQLRLAAELEPTRPAFRQALDRLRAESPGLVAGERR